MVLLYKTWYCFHVLQFTFLVLILFSSCFANIYVLLSFTCLSNRLQKVVLGINCKLWE